MFTLSVSFDSDRLVRSAKEYGARVADRLAEIALEELDKEAPIASGALVLNQEIEDQSTDNHEIRLVGPNVEETPYAWFVYNGRSWVFPLNGGVLHWVNFAGEDVFAKSAKPTAPNKWIDRAYETLQEKLDEGISSVNIDFG